VHTIEKEPLIGAELLIALMGGVGVIVALVPTLVAVIELIE
jgi:hypothetical protein